VPFSLLRAAETLRLNAYDRSVQIVTEHNFPSCRRGAVLQPGDDLRVTMKVQYREAAAPERDRLRTVSSFGTSKAHGRS
jgi:hypothetical protein